jgi:Ca-activated chloride channel family protein
MIHFEQAGYLYLFFAVPILVSLFVWLTFQNKKLRKQFGALIGLERLAPELSTTKRPLKFGLILVAFCFLVVALANPRMGNKTEKIKRSGVDVYVALDISKSMWAEDIMPNRMIRAKQFTEKFIDAVRGDRVGLILFAGNPYLQIPLTTDYSAAQLFVQMADPKLDITQGTAIEKAIDMVVELGNKRSEKKQQALVIVTDGENHEQGAIEAAKAASAKGVTTYIVGIGTEQGAPIPLKLRNGRQFQLDKSGQVVQSKMNAGLLRDIASASGGRFYNIKNGDGIIDRLKSNFSKLEQSEFEEQQFDVYESYYYYFAAIALFLLIAEFLIGYRKNKWFKAKA